jgi:hypothetical protein
MVGKFGETLVVDWGLAKTINVNTTQNSPQHEMRDVLGQVKLEPHRERRCIRLFKSDRWGRYPSGSTHCKAGRWHLIPPRDIGSSIVD